MKFWKTLLWKLGCHGNDNVDVHDTTILKFSQVNLWKIAKFGGHNVEGVGSKSPPVLTGLKGPEKISNPSESFTTVMTKSMPSLLPRMFCVPWYLLRKATKIPIPLIIIMEITTVLFYLLETYVRFQQTRLVKQHIQRFQECKVWKYSSWKLC